MRLRACVTACLLPGGGGGAVGGGGMVPLFVFMPPKELWEA